MGTPQWHRVPSWAANSPAARASACRGRRPFPTQTSHGGILMPTRTGEGAVAAVHVLGERPAPLRPAFVRRIGSRAGGRSQLVPEASALENYQLLAGVYGLERSAWRGRVADLAERLTVATRSGYRCGGSHSARGPNSN